MFSCILVTFPYCVTGQEWYLTVSIPDLRVFPYSELQDLRVRRYHTCIGQNIMFEVNVIYWQSQLSVKCKSRVPEQAACLLRMSRTITMQEFIDLAIIVRETHFSKMLTKANGR